MRAVGRLSSAFIADARQDFAADCEFCWSSGDSSGMFSDWIESIGVVCVRPVRETDFGEERGMLRGIACVAVCGVLAGAAQAQNIVDFRVDGDALDTDMSGFVEGTEFTAMGTSGGMDDGVLFSFMPSTNLVGFPRFLLSETTGIQFAGGGGSSISFTFMTNQAINLMSYEISDGGFILDTPAFDILDGATTLSSGNDASDAVEGVFTAFDGGPILIEAGVEYTFVATGTGAAVQSFLGAFEYSIVPGPGVASLLALGGVVGLRRRR